MLLLLLDAANVPLVSELAESRRIHLLVDDVLEVLLVDVVGGGVLELVLVGVY